MGHGVVGVQSQRPTVGRRRASSGFPCSFNALPALLWASTYSGLSANARRQGQLLRPACLARQGYAQVVVRLGIVRLQFHRPAVAGDRFGNPACRTIGLPQVVVVDGRIPLQLDLRAQYSGWPFRACPFGKQLRPEGAGRRADPGDREDLLIDMVGSVKTPRLMVPDGNC